MKVVVISPHPDDETLGAGGTLLRYKAEGHQIYWINVTNTSDEERWGKEFIEKRKTQIEKVLSLYCFDDFYDLHIEPSSLSDEIQGYLITEISKIIDEIRPEVLLLPDKNDAHSDHLNVYKAAIASSKVFRHPSVKMILTMEILSETDFGDAYEIFHPNYYVDITDYIDKKMEAINIYDTELAAPPFPRNTDAVRALAIIRGGTAGVRYAEAFRVIKMIR